MTSVQWSLYTANTVLLHDAAAVFTARLRHNGYNMTATPQRLRLSAGRCISAVTQHTPRVQTFVSHFAEAIRRIS